MEPKDLTSEQQEMIKKLKDGIETAAKKYKFDLNVDENKLESFIIKFNKSDISPEIRHELVKKYLSSL